MESATEAGKYAASASRSAVTAEKTKEDALRKVGEKKREAIEAIQNQEETSVGKITTHTDGEIQRIQNQATDSKAGLEQTITNADASKKELEHSIETAGTSKTALDKSVELAGTAKTELDTSIREAGTAKTALDGSTETAGTVQEDLSATVKQAGTLDTSLGEEIETGTQLKTDLVASGEKAVQDIQAAGSEQLGKMQAVAEAFTADREQIAKNKEDVGSLKEELGDIESKFEIETEAFSNKCSIIRNNTPNNFTGNQITGVKQYFDFGENAALTKIKMNIKASNDDTVVLEIATLDGNIIATAEKAVTTEYTDVVFDLENIVIKEPVSIFVYTKGTNLLSYGLYATPYDDQSFSYIFPDGTRKSAFKIGTSEILKPTASNNKQCLVLFFDYTSKIIKNISDSISQNIDITLLKSGKAADAKVVGDKLSKLEEDLSNKITKFYASNQGETRITDSDNGKIMDMVLYGKSEQKQYKGINLLPPDINYGEYVEVSIPKGSLVFWVTDGIPAKGGNFRFFNEDKTESMWFGVDSGATSARMSLTIDAKYVQNLIGVDFDLSKICLGVGNEPIYEPYTGGIPSPSPDYPQEIKSVVNPTVKVSSEDGTQFETVTLPYTLNATPVSSGGNVTIDGQQYIADYVDLERGKVVRKIGKVILTGEENWEIGFENWKTYPHAFRAEELKKDILKGDTMNAKYMWYQKHANLDLNSMNAPYDGCIAVSDIRFSSVNEFTNELKKQNSNGTPLIAYYITSAPQEENLSLEEIEFLKLLSTYYSATNVTVDSEQLDGYTVFNYPISMANGWNYVKQQLNDNRDYIYDMDLQSAEAYVNSEYAVALTELEVM